MNELIYEPTEISQLPRPPPPRPLQPQLPPRKMMAAAQAPKVVTAMAAAQAPKVVVAMLIPPVMSLSLIMQQRCVQRHVQPAGMALPLHGVACSPLTHFQVTAQRVACLCTLKKRPTGCRTEEWELQCGF